VFATILGVSNRFDTPSVLQGILTKAIDALRPAANAPNKLHAQGIYDLLLYRYVQQFNQNEIANQLGISVRHLRRLQNLAIYELAGQLWKQYHPANNQPGSYPASFETPQSSTSDQFVEELDWLRKYSGNVATDLSLGLDTVQVMIEPFAEQNGAQLVFPAEISGLVHVHPVAFQQILLSLLTFVIQSMPGKQIHIGFSKDQGWQTLTIAVVSQADFVLDKTSVEKSLETVKKMVELSKGEFTIDLRARAFNARVAFQIVVPKNVLVIDDNPEIVTMMQRYVNETHFRITGLNNPQEAVEFALRALPDIIVIDIMMPQVDGLQVLSRLKHHPVLGKCPIIVCSVLPQKDLAASLGAAGFIQKPIQRDTFISTLNHGLGPT